MSRQYLLTSVLLLAICSCSKTALLLPVQSHDPSTTQNITAYDFRYGNYGQVNAAIRATEKAHQHIPTTDSYQADIKEDLLFYLNDDKSADGYFFDVNNHLVAGAHITPSIIDSTLKLSSFNTLIEKYIKLYGPAIIDKVKMQARFKTNRSKVLLTESDNNDSTGSFDFVITYLPVSISETAVELYNQNWLKTKSYLKTIRINK